MRMSTFALVIIARILHILSSTVWAGFVIIAGLALLGVPRGTKPEEARQVRRSTIGRAAHVVAPAAIVSFLSGLYLFSALHAGLHTPTEIALGAGAFSAVLSFFVGAIGSRGPELQLAKLDALTTRSASETARIAALNRRVVFTGRLTAILLAISGAAMAAARFL
jgi:uncharacterized membrane protein